MFTELQTTQSLTRSLQLISHLPRRSIVVNSAFLQRCSEAFALQVAELNRLLGTLKLELPGEEIFSHHLGHGLSVHEQAATDFGKEIGRQLALPEGEGLFHHEVFAFIQEDSGLVAMRLNGSDFLHFHHHGKRFIPK
jgi:hypothetical protein